MATARTAVMATSTSLGLRRSAIEPIGTAAAMPTPAATAMPKPTMIIDRPRILVKNTAQIVNHRPSPRADTALPHNNVRRPLVTSAALPRRAIASTFQQILNDACGQPQLAAPVQQ